MDNPVYSICAVKFRDDDESTINYLVTCSYFPAVCQAIEDDVHERFPDRKIGSVKMDIWDTKDPFYLCGPYYIINIVSAPFG